MESSELSKIVSDFKDNVSRIQASLEAAKRKVKCLACVETPGGTLCWEINCNDLPVPADLQVQRTSPVGYEVRIETPAGPITYPVDQSRVPAPNENSIFARKSGDYIDCVANCIRMGLQGDALVKCIEGCATVTKEA